MAKVMGELAARSASEEFSATIVHCFLATVVGKRVPEREWPQVFNELASRYLELGRRIAETPVTTRQIEQFVAQADVARKAGNLERADELLEQAEKHALADAAQLKELSRQSSRQAASLLASRASLAFARLEHARGAELLQKAFRQREDDVSTETLWWLIEASDTWMKLGQSARALRLAEQARGVAGAQVAA